MHEVAMALSVIHIVEQAAKENHLTKIQKISIRKGEFCGILEDAFSFAFDNLKGGQSGSNPLLKDARLEFIMAESIAECMNCHARFELQRYKKVCPFCGGVMLSYPEAYDFFVESIEGE